MRDIFVLLICILILSPERAIGSPSFSRITDGAQADDRAIELKASAELMKRFLPDPSMREPRVTSFNRVALITGYAPDLATKTEIGVIVSKVPNVRTVINEIFLGAPGGWVTAARDALLATSVKASLFDSRGVNENLLKIVTESGTVFLMGVVTQREMTRASEITARVSGVRRVVQAFEVITEAQAIQIDLALGGKAPTEALSTNDLPSSNSVWQQYAPHRSKVESDEALAAEHAKKWSATVEKHRRDTSTEHENEVVETLERRKREKVSIDSSVSQPPRHVEPVRSLLSLAVSPSGIDPNGVVTLTITTNSDTASLRVNEDEEGGRADGRYSVRRFARVGENKFEVVATDRFGNTQRQTVSVVREPLDTTVRFATLNPGALRAKPATNAVAIIIGIQDYRRVPKADFASNDARVFYDYAIRGLGVRPENVKLLTDEQADDVAILGAFKNWLPLKSRGAKTDVYVFYSGHGYPSDDGTSLYFLPYGVDRQFLDRTAIKQSEIVSALQAVSPRSVTLFLDACYSGQSRTGETLLAGARPILIQPKASTFPSNFTVLSASAPEQIASSSADLKHGIFSYFLMKGMEGEADQNKDGAITVREMQAYLSDSVGRKAMSISRTQQPQLVGDQSRVLMQR
jgi:osmotically-inducible protein OsmY